MNNRYSRNYGLPAANRRIAEVHGMPENRSMIENHRLRNTGKKKEHNNMNDHGMMADHRMIENHGMMADHNMMENHGMMADHRMMENHGMMADHRMMENHGMMADHSMMENHSMMGDNKMERCPMPPGLGDPAPEFTAVTTSGIINLSDYRGKWLILFSHPGDFTPVCTTEFIAFAQRYQDFRDRNAELLGLSIDSNPSHIAWIINIYRHTGVEIPFPIIDDRSMEISRMYGMLQPGVSATATVRNVFFIDPAGIVRAKLIYPLTNGRNIGELLRLLDALQTTDAEKVATPANWRPGQPVILPVPKTVAEAKQRMAQGHNCVDWYLCFKTDGN